MSYCPACGSDFTRRIARSPVMRLIYASRHILCSDCGQRSLILFPALAKRRAKAAAAAEAKQVLRAAATR